MTATLTSTSTDLRHADDGRLLADFVHHRRQEAFAELVRRHGPMVLAVCRSVLGETQAAEDAAQSVFLTLAQKASALQTHKTIVGWLHRVSWYVAARAAEAVAIRRRHEQESARMRPSQSRQFDHMPADELHAALRSLPEKYRLALLLHHMEGRTEQETAALLGCSPSAASMRLSRGRDMLRERMVKRGFTVSAAVLAGILTRNAAAAVPSAFVTSTATLATAALAGQPAATATVAALSKGAIHMLRVSQLKIAAAALVLSAMTCGLVAYVATSMAAAPATTATAPDAPGLGKTPGVAPKGKGLHFVTGPADAEKVIGDFLRRNPARLGDVTAIKQTPPLVTWWMSPQDIADGKGVETAQFNYPQSPERRYHYLLLIDGRGVGTVNLLEPANGPSQVAGLSNPGDAVGIVKALAALPELPEIKAGSFEVRYLNLGAVAGTGQSFVIWLKADEGVKDYIYTFAGQAIASTGPWEANKLYTTEEFFKTLQPRAARQVEMYKAMDAGRGPGTGRGTGGDAGGQP